MQRLVTVSIIALVLSTTVACAASSRDRVKPLPFDNATVPTRAGIAVVASGGIAGWEHVTLLDSATARYVTVTRRACARSCLPLDSASGTLEASDVARIYAVAADERAIANYRRPRLCDACEQALVTTAVFGNQRRTVVRSGRETSPEVLGRVHVALAEAIRAARGEGSGETVSTEPNE